ncbi:MAG: hypothetical protein CBC71_01295 [Rhodobacteraceae bacterium TMED111]|nr:MAG: hypothetical protein CBC71_01295 [Rhodobacteraceae bacterium TMED111]|tara:strand:- start:11639 stop:12202 length:564 start_codon:yes stop_codon:yes gene_type:complete
MARPNSASAKRAAANRERAKKIQAANKAKKTAALERAKGSTKRVQQRRKTTTARVAKKTTPKKTPVKKTVAKKTVAKKTTPKIPGRLGRIAAVATAIGAPIGVAVSNAFRKKDPTFGETFKKARKEKGPMSTFNYKGKKYSTVTKDQVEKAGHSTLRSYLNAGGKKKKTGLTTKRRKTGGPPLRRRR